MNMYKKLTSRMMPEMAVRSSPPFSGIILLVTLYMFMAGNPAIEPVLAANSIAFFLGILLFAWVAMPALTKR